MAATFRVGSWAMGLALVLALGGCSRKEPAGGAGAPGAPPPMAAAAPSAATGGAQKADENAPAVSRKLVKKASLELEVSSTRDALARATRIADAQGGFVATSEQSAAQGDGSREQTSVSLTMRVPADHFVATLEALRKLGTGPGSERVATEDVSEEFIDLEARIKNQRALEAQFLEILTRAAKVEDALHVQREIAGVRTEIDRMEGRRRFLERETALSTITLQFTTAEPLVRVGFGDFGYAVSHAASDAVNVGGGIITGGIRLLGVLVPLAFLLGVPAALALRFALKRRQARVAL